MTDTADATTHDGATPALPRGPWVLVVGMHRSGTSAVTGALHHLGLAVPDTADLMAGQPDNPVHYESLSMVQADDQVLEAAGATWTAPAGLEPGWETAPDVAALDPTAGAAAARAFPAPGAVVWKDPRVCLTLPYWRRLLPEPVAAVLVWRGPVAVARSLQQRDSLPFSLGLALWERYTRLALRDLAGLDVLVVGYDDLLDERESGVAAMAEWLTDTVPGLDPGRDEIAAAAASLSDDLRHQTGTGSAPADQGDLVRRLAALAGSHRPFASPSLPEEAEWVDELLTERQSLEHANRYLAAAVESRDHLRDLVENHRQRLVERDRQATEQEQREVELSSEVASLRRELTDARGRAVVAEEELLKVYETTSWRATKPLRALSALRGPRPEGGPPTGGGLADPPDGPPGR